MMRKLLVVAVAWLSLCSAVSAQSAPNGGGMGVPNTPPAFQNMINVTQQGVSAAAADNATALQAAINLAVSTGQALYIPSASSCYKYTAPLTISGNLTIVGDEANGNWPGASAINIPSGTPAVQGSVLCPSSNGSDAIDISGTALTVGIRNLAILFQTPYTGTGDGIHYVPTGTNQGLSGAFWENVTVYGHDGNHYAVNLQNPIYNTLIHIQGFGGGLLKVFGNSTTQHFGNSVWFEFYCNMFVQGTSDCFNLNASNSQSLNLEAFIRPQANVNNTIGGVTPPTSAQLIWNQGANATDVNVFGADWETNVGSPLAFGNPSYGGVDWNSVFTTASAFQYTEPTGTGGGVLYNPKYGTGNFTNTTASGTISQESLYNFPGWHLNSTNATTYSVACTLCVAPPISGTNTTITRNAAIYSTGEIFTTGDLSSNGGLFVSGTAQITSGVSGFIKEPAFVSNGTKFTTGGTCSAPASTAGGASAGTISLPASGTVASCTIIVTFNGATGFTAPNGWSCWINDQTKNSTPAAYAAQTASSTTTATFQLGASTAASDVLSFGCMAY